MKPEEESAKAEYIIKGTKTTDELHNFNPANEESKTVKDFLYLCSVQMQGGMVTPEQDIPMKFICPHLTRGNSCYQTQNTTGLGCCHHLRRLCSWAFLKMWIYRTYIQKFYIYWTRTHPGMWFLELYCGWLHLSTLLKWDG